MSKKLILQKPDGYAVSAVLEIPEAPKGIVIAIHGFASSRECATYQMLRRRLPAAGYGMIGIELPGHGTEESSAEPLRVEGCINSIEAAERCAASAWPQLPVSYFASSFGAYLTGLYISTRAHGGRSAFFRSAAVNMPELFSFDENAPGTEEKRRWKAELEERGYFITGEALGKPMKVTREFKEDLERHDLFRLFHPLPEGAHRIAMAHGAADEVIDPEAAGRFSGKFGIPITYFEGEGHSLGNDPGTPDKVADLAIALYDGKESICQHWRKSSKEEGASEHLTEPA